MRLRFTTFPTTFFRNTHCQATKRPKCFLKVPRPQAQKFRKAVVLWLRHEWKTPKVWARSRRTAISAFAGNCFATPGSAGGITTTATVKAHIPAIWTANPPVAYNDARGGGGTRPASFRPLFFAVGDREPTLSPKSTSLESRVTQDKLALKGLIQEIPPNYSENR